MSKAESGSETDLDQCACLKTYMSWILNSNRLGWSLMSDLSYPGPDGYPRVLDYSTFEFTTLPYSKNFTTRSSSRVVTISSFCPIIQIFGMGWHHSFLDNVSMMLSLDQSDSDCITHTDILDKEQLLSLFESIDQSIYKYHVP